MGLHYTNPTSMSSIFNKFSATIGNTLTTNGVNQASSIFSFKTISCESVIKMINELKPNKAVGLDNVSSWLLKDAADIVAPSLTSLFNISITLAAFRPHENWQRYLLFLKKGINKILLIADRYR